jgi:hypothetical protein
MKKTSKILVLVAGIVLITGVGAIYALFHGYFDYGKFEIRRFQWSSAGQAAMVAERSDDEALGGLDYYVLVGTHVFNPKELRHAYYSDAVVFSALCDDCIRLTWASANKLTISCKGSTIDSDHINSQKKQIDNIAISYEKIALK